MNHGQFDIRRLKMTSWNTVSFHITYATLLKPYNSELGVSWCPVFKSGSTTWRNYFIDKFVVEPPQEYYLDLLKSRQLTSVRTQFFFNFSISKLSSRACFIFLVTWAWSLYFAISASISCLIGTCCTIFSVKNFPSTIIWTIVRITWDNLENYLTVKKEGVRLVICFQP